jgi:hypothetical protein
VLRKAIDNFFFKMQVYIHRRKTMKKAFFLMTVLAAQSLVAADTMTPQANGQKPAGMTTMQAPKENTNGPVQDRFTTPDDGRIGVEVRAILIEQLGADQAKGVILIIDKGDVQLNGNILSEDKKRALIDALIKTKGVKSVKSKLVPPASNGNSNGMMKK